MLHRWMRWLAGAEVVVWIYATALTVIWFAFGTVRNHFWVLLVGMVVAIAFPLVRRLSRLLDDHLHRRFPGRARASRPGVFLVWGAWCLVVTWAMTVPTQQIMLLNVYWIMQPPPIGRLTWPLLGWSYAATLAGLTIMLLRDLIAGGDARQSLLTIFLHLAFLPPAIALALEPATTGHALAFLLAAGMVGAYVAHGYFAPSHRDPPSRAWILGDAP